VLLELTAFRVYVLLEVVCYLMSAFGVAVLHLSVCVQGLYPRICDAVTLSASNQ
jgi:hypothetical protein